MVDDVVMDTAGKDTRGEIISNHPLISQIDSIDKHQLVFACVNSDICTIVFVRLLTGIHSTVGYTPDSHSNTNTSPRPSVYLT